MEESNEYFEYYANESNVMTNGFMMCSLDVRDWQEVKGSKEKHDEKKEMRKWEDINMKIEKKYQNMFDMLKEDSDSSE